MRSTREIEAGLLPRLTRQGAGTERDANHKLLWFDHYGLRSASGFARSRHGANGR
ncbi:hypothetical protein [Pyrinomonas sp.]|uniref:hypothetical protein n=1 Tax=Pyrinomonas sp. TaxID=2080306 RepID=UPI003323EB7B